MGIIKCCYSVFPSDELICRDIQFGVFSSRVSLSFVDDELRLFKAPGISNFFTSLHFFILAYFAVVVVYMLSTFIWKEIQSRKKATVSECVCV